MKTIVKPDCVKVSGGVKHFFCPYCGHGLTEIEAKNLHCNDCGNYLVGTEDRVLRMTKFRDE